MTNNDTALSPAYFIKWFRDASPYIHAHHERTFVFYLNSKTNNNQYFMRLMHDIALLSSLEIRIVIVYDALAKAAEYLTMRNIKVEEVNHLPIVSADALECLEAACGQISTSISRYLSMGLTNAPNHDHRIRVVSGNFITAQPIGVREGIDFLYTGKTRRVDHEMIETLLVDDSIVLISPLGYSPTGEVFYLPPDSLSADIAVALKAAKWVCLGDSEGIYDQDGQLCHYLNLYDAQQWRTQNVDSPHCRLIDNAIRVCKNGVQRTHLTSLAQDGNLLLELFTRDGVGTLISGDLFEQTRKATLQDVAGLAQLIRPLEEKGALVRRSKEKLELEVEHFTLQERDGMVVACAALFPYFPDKMAEFACFAVHDQYRGEQRGDALLSLLEKEARHKNITHAFVFTTHTAHWFRERGFIEGTLEDIPEARRKTYTPQRNSKVFIKNLSYHIR